MSRVLRSAAPCSSASRAGGFTLIEIMIAIVIGLFLTGGLLTLVQTLKRTSGAQTAMSQLQDNERMAMTLIADVIQSAGYWPNPTTVPAAAEFPTVAAFPVGSQNVAFTSAGQTIVGAGGYNDVVPDQVIVVRYATSGTDNVINCMGNPNAIAAPGGVLVNAFSLAADPAVPGTYDLMCSFNGNAPVQLVGGITNMQIYYGVQTNPGVSNNSVDTYLDGNAVTAGNYWGSVLSVKIKLTFKNPMYGALTGQGQTQIASMPQTVSFERVIDVMNRTGVTTT
ncbi:MAG TPA: PilW family protein [Steroidobacteraceae bacterium]|nr:PilW family protein [Steroidobacteraceae bacterium]